MYFAYDTARDAYISQDIYKIQDLKLIGPPVSGDPGLFHGPLYWYLVGPAYLLFDGDPAIVSALFRVINGLGVFVIFAAGLALYGSGVGYLSALVYAVSFEESQYAMYVGNPSLGVLTIGSIFFGAALIYRRHRLAKYGFMLMIVLAALSTQLNLMFGYTFGLVILLMVMLRTSLVKLTKKYVFAGLACGLAILSSFLVAELRYNFRGVSAAYRIIAAGQERIGTENSRLDLYADKYVRMYKDNWVGTEYTPLVALIAIGLTGWMLYRARKSTAEKISLIWILGFLLLMAIGGHTAYYTNAGLGMGVIVSGCFAIAKIFTKNRIMAIIILGLSIWGNLRLIYQQAPRSIVLEMITQSMMKLADEYRMIDTMYGVADGHGFTVRLTGIPYRVQTLWAYLFTTYGKKKYGYLPLWETGNTFGFPGELPTVASGTTCLRFWLVEPTFGLPKSLVTQDRKMEDDISIISASKVEGEFELEIRQARDPGCIDFIL